MSDRSKTLGIRRLLLYSGAITIIVMVSVAWLSLWQSATYEQCIRNYPKHKTAQPNQESLPYLFFVRGRGTGCIGIAVAANEDAITALSAVFTAFFTGVLFMSTAGLWWVTERTLGQAKADSERQAKDMEVSLAVARQVADATTGQTRIAADNAMKLERPHVFVESPRLTDETYLRLYGKNITSSKTVSFQAEFDTFNYGRSPAIFKERSASIFVVCAGDLPEQPAVNPNDVFVDSVVIPANGSRKGWRTLYRGALDDALIDALQAARAPYVGEEKFKARTKLYLFVRLRYDGVYSTSDEVGFLWEYLFSPSGSPGPAGGWIPCDIPNYSYRKLSD